MRIRTIVLLILAISVLHVVTYTPVPRPEQQVPVDHHKPSEQPEFEVASIALLFNTSISAKGFILCDKVRKRFEQYGYTSRYFAGACDLTEMQMRQWFPDIEVKRIEACHRELKGDAVCVRLDLDKFNGPHDHHRLFIIRDAATCDAEVDRMLIGLAMPRDLRQAQPVPNPRLLKVL